MPRRSLGDELSVTHSLCSRHVFAAQGYASTLGQTGGGIYESTTNGTTWSLITAGTDLQYAPVASLTFDTPNECVGACGVIWAATYGLGSWSFDTQSTSCP
jgi:hypothetical protein